MNTIQQTIARAHYVATEAQVEQLAVAQWKLDNEAETHGLTYLRVEVAAAQAKTGTAKRGRHSKESQLTILKEVHAGFYAAALRGLIQADPTIAQEEGLESAESSRRALERNRRSTRYRTSYRELVGFVERGGDLRTLDVETVSKAGLRSFGKAPEPEDRTERSLERAQGAILRAINRLARASPDDALERLDTLMATLQTRRGELANKVQGTEKRESAAVRTRVGAPQFHRPGAQ